MKSRINKLLVVVSIVLVGVFCLQRVYAAYTTDSLVASYNMDEGSGTSVADSTGNGNTGTTSGSPTWVTGGLSFDGTDDKISVPDSAYLDTPSFSYEMWFTMPSSAAWATASTFPRLFDKIPTGNASGVNLTLDRSLFNLSSSLIGTTWASASIGSTSGAVILSDSYLLDYSKTYHVVLTFDDATKVGKIYLNGVVVASAVANSSYLGNSTALYIGSNTTSNTRNFKGTMHRVSVYNKALSGAEVLANNIESRGYNYGTTSDANSVSSSLSSVGATTTSTVGVQSFGVEVIARDSDGLALSDKIVYLLTDRGVLDYIPVNVASTSADGSAVFTVSSVHSGTSTVTAFVEGVQIGDTYEIVFPEVEYSAIPVPEYSLGFEGDYTDSSGNGIHGSSSGAATIVSDANRGQVLSLNRTASTFVSVTNDLPESYTKSVWVNLATATAGNYNILSSNICSAYGDTLWVTNSSAGGSPTTQALKAGQLGPSFVNHVWNTTVFPINTWVHTAVTYDSDTYTYKLYQNGMLVSASTTSQSSHATSSGQVIGNCGTGTGVTNLWSGKIDDVTLWGSVLDDEQIAGVYYGDIGLTPTEPDAPYGVSATPSNTQVALSWTAPAANNSAITDYVVEYKPSSSGTWLTFSDGVSTATTTTITGLTNTTSYDFRVSAVNAIGTGDPSSTVVAAAGVTTYFHVLSGGQSLSIGTYASPVLSSTQPYNNLSLSPNSQGVTATFIPLIESSLETPSSGIANTLRAADSLIRPVIVGLHGSSSARYTLLKKGTTSYAKGIQQATTTKTLVESLGGVYEPLGVTIVHGESDYYNSNLSGYEDDLVEWQNDYETDVNSATGLTGTLPMFINQMNAGWVGDLAQAQYNAHKNNPGKIILVGPKYQYEYHTDHVHLTNTNSRHMGEMFAKVIKKVSIDGDTWNPLMPTSIYRTDNIITIDYDISVGPLAFDTSIVAERPDYGFEFVQTGETASTSISSVELINSGTQVKITLDGIPDGTDQKVRYAWTCYGGGSGFPLCGKASDATYVGGNLRDSDSSVSLASDSTGLPLYNWGVTFEEDVVEATEPDAPSSFAGSAGDAQVSLSWTAPSSNGSAITDYLIEYKQSSSDTWLTFSDGVSTATSTTVTSLINTTAYSFRVSAVNAVGTSSPSSVISVTPDKTYAGTSVSTVIKEILNESREYKEENNIKNGCIMGALFDIYTGKSCSLVPNIVGVVFNKNLKLGDVDSDVKLLQQYLNSKGFVVAGSGPGSLGNETNIFGSLTRNAVIRFQKANNITPAVGYFGPITRGFMK